MWPDSGHLLVLRPGGRDSLEKATKPVSSQGESLATTQPGAPAQVGEATWLQQVCGPPAEQLAAHHALQPHWLTQAHPIALLMPQDLGPPPGLSTVPSSGPCCPVGKQESKAGRQVGPRVGAFGGDDGSLPSAPPARSQDSHTRPGPQRQHRQTLPSQPRDSMVTEQEGR